MRKYPHVLGKKNSGYNPNPWLPFTPPSPKKKIKKNGGVKVTPTHVVPVHARQAEARLKIQFLGLRVCVILCAYIRIYAVHIRLRLIAEVSTDAEYMHIKANISHSAPLRRRGLEWGGYYSYYSGGTPSCVRARCERARKKKKVRARLKLK